MRITVCLLLPGILASAHATVQDKVKDVFTPAPFDQQKIDGYLGERMKVNLEGRLLHVDEQGIIEGFQHRPGKQDWIGEHAGKFLDAAANTWEYTHDARLKTLMDRIAHNLMAAQLPDGYLGTYTDDKRWTSWDVWVHKYDLLGLLSYYRVTRDPAALQTARKIGDLLVKTFGDKPGQRDIIHAGEHVGMAATSVLEPMVYLYRATGSRPYLDFCYYITRAWEEPGGPKIISSIMATGSVYKTANAKAYEMLSNLVGLAELYRLTGDVTFFKPLPIAWEDIVARRLYISGTASSKEHFTDNHVLPADESAHVGEGCVTVTWIQFNLELLRLTGDARYADQIERSVFNQLLAAQDPTNGNICYFTPLNGEKEATPGINCCVSSEPRGISLIPRLVWGTKDSGIAVLTYAPGELSTALAKIESATDYPQSGKITLTIRKPSGAAFPIYLRAPSWTKSFTASAGGETYKADPGEFLTISRKWKDGENINISLDISPRLISGAPQYPNSVAIERGPQVLALETDLNPGIPDPTAAGPAATGTPQLRNAAQSLPITWLGREAWSLPGKDGTALILVPFSDAKTYRVWLAKP